MKANGELGEEFASKCKSASGLEAKLLLYRELDDGSGTYFHSVFKEEDRDDPYFLQTLGARLPPFTATQRVEAKQFIIDQHLPSGSWRTKDWYVDLVCDKFLKRYSCFTKGKLGDMFLATLPKDLTDWENVAAKRILMDTLGCQRLRDYIFTKQDTMGVLTRPLVVDTMVSREGLFMHTTPEQIQALAEKFAGIKKSECICGLTFGWVDETGEWHLYGDLMSTNLIRCWSKDIPRVFGEINFETEKKLLPYIWDQTFLCRVVAEPRVSALASCEGASYIQPVRTVDIIEVKWAARMRDVFNFNKHKASILEGAALMRKECKHG